MDLTTMLVKKHKSWLIKTFLTNLCGTKIVRHGPREEKVSLSDTCFSSPLLQENDSTLGLCFASVAAHDLSKSYTRSKMSNMQLFKMRVRHADFFKTTANGSYVLQRLLKPSLVLLYASSSQVCSSSVKSLHLKTAGLNSTTIFVTT